MRDLPGIKEVQICRHCGGDEFTVRYTFSGSGKYSRRFDGGEICNTEMHDGLIMKPGKLAYCADCLKPIAKYEGEFE